MKFNKIELEVKNALSSLPIKKRGILYIAGNILILVLKKMKCIYFVIIYSNMLKKNWFLWWNYSADSNLNLIKSKKIFDKKKTQSFTGSFF